MNQSEPMGMPRGTIRAALTLILVALCGAMLFFPVVEGATDIRAMFVMLTGFAVKDYFADRSAQNESDGPVLPDAVVNS